jgi:hypothetical protein
MTNTPPDRSLRSRSGGDPEKPDQATGQREIRVMVVDDHPM